MITELLTLVAFCLYLGGRHVNSKAQHSCWDCWLCSSPHAEGCKSPVNSWKLLIPHKMRALACLAFVFESLEMRHSWRSKFQSFFLQTLQGWCLHLPPWFLRSGTWNKVRKALFPYRNEQTNICSNYSPGLTGCLMCIKLKTRFQSLGSKLLPDLLLQVWITPARFWLFPAIFKIYWDKMDRTSNSRIQHL